MIVFLSNYYNHHQSSFSREMFRLTNGEYRFIETSRMSEERAKLGWGGENDEFVFYYMDDPVHCQTLINTADVVIYGSAPYILLTERLKQKKLTFAYSERIYKKELQFWELPIRIIRHYFSYRKHKNFYLLCASAYTARDFSLTRCFINKTYKWGYFPEVKEYADIDEIIELKNPSSILWVGRVIGWKHPELPVLIAKKLKEEGYKFELNMIGTGELEDSIRQMIIDNNLQDFVHFLAPMKPDKVRDYMERSQIYIFTSDRNEGWGAVLNESMNSGCAVVASHAIGSVPYLIENGKNGLIYKDGDFESLYKCAEKLLDNKELCNTLGKEAYQTMVNSWNAKEAAKRFLKLSEDIAQKGYSDLFDNGVCSRAPIIKDKWFK